MTMNVSRISIGAVVMGGVLVLASLAAAQVIQNVPNTADGQAALTSPGPNAPTARGTLGLEGMALLLIGDDVDRAKALLLQMNGRIQKLLAEFEKSEWYKNWYATDTELKNAQDRAYAAALTTAAMLDPDSRHWIEAAKAGKLWSKHRDKKRHGYKDFMKDKFTDDERREIARSQRLFHAAYVAETSASEDTSGEQPDSGGAGPRGESRQYTELIKKFTETFKEFNEAIQKQDANDVVEKDDLDALLDEIKADIKKARPLPGFDEGIIPPS